MATTAIVSIETYLSTSYCPDVEYLDGVLKEKPVVQIVHGRVQVLIGMWFENHRREWGIYAAVEVRTRTSANAVRLPDVVVVSRENHELGTLTTPPLIAIEVRSPSDTQEDLDRRAAALAGMGTQNVWLVDPYARTGQIWSEAGWVGVDGGRMEAVGSGMYLDLGWVWGELED